MSLSDEQRHALWRARWAVRLVPKERRALHDVLVKQAMRGRVNPFWAEGATRPHLALDLMTMMTLCVRRSYENGNRRPATLIGIPCFTCRRRWKRAVREAEKLRAMTTPEPETNPVAEPATEPDRRAS